ncbi:hypothetical protein ILUMI_10659, partial [Ignelater luminosus]
MKFSAGFTQVFTDGTTVAQLMNSNHDRFKISVSIRTSEAYLYLCSGSTIPNTSCYLVILGKISSIGKCQPQRGCNYGVYFSEKPLVNSQEWNHFTVEKINEQLTVYKAIGEEIILTYNDPRYFRTSYLLVSSNDEFIATEKISQTLLGEDMNIRDPYLCMAMFVAMCAQCTLKFEVFYRTSAGKVELLEETEIKPEQ